MISKKELAKMMDYSLLKPFLTETEIIQGCKEAVELDVASVCVRPSDLLIASPILEGSNVILSTVIGFPHGTTTTHTKVEEAKEAIKKGCKELDMVCNIGAVKSGKWKYVEDDLKAMTKTCHGNGVKLKVIFENCYLEKEEIIKLCNICSKLSVDWVKTSTGFGTDGATDEDLILMRKNSAPNVQVKAAGGVRDLKRALEVHELQCTRFGCTTSRAILEEYNQQ